MSALLSMAGPTAMYTAVDLRIILFGGKQSAMARCIFSQICSMFRRGEPFTKLIMYFVVPVALSYLRNVVSLDHIVKCLGIGQKYMRRTGFFYGKP